jgi:hypothetical protein
MKVRLKFDSCEKDLNTIDMNDESSFLEDSDCHPLALQNLSDYEKVTALILPDS